MRRMILVATLACNAAGGALAQTPAAPPAPSALTSITGTVTYSDVSAFMFRAADGKTLMAMLQSNTLVTQTSGEKIVPADIKAGVSVTIIGTPPGTDGMMDVTRVVVAPPKSLVQGP